jgi:hypothetical protein
LQEETSQISEDVLGNDDNTEREFLIEDLIDVIENDDLNG